MLVGHKSTVSNPYRTPTSLESTYGLTTFNYDALGRVIKVIPPDGSSSANNVVTSYSGNSTTVTDQAGTQRRSFTDALGRLIRVDEPYTGTYSGTPATPGTGSVTISGSEQSIDNGYWTEECVFYYEEGDCAEWREVWHPNTIWDWGSVWITVNGLTKTVSYGQGSTAASIASALGNAFNNDGSSVVTASVNGTTITFTAKTTGAATNYSLSAGSSTSDPGDFSTVV